jgi:nucleoside-diphosphate-sugar epimerase
MRGPGGRNAILITGTSGFLGSLVAAKALQETDAVLVLPFREPHTREAILSPIVAELTAEGRPPSAQELDRVVTLPLSSVDRIEELAPELARLGVADILHCAGCLSYFNVEKLQAGNIELTRRLLALGAALDVRRFVYLSTAYSVGFFEGSIDEALHEQHGVDPTDYTRTKREAEWMVAESGLPWIIVRPSIVIGSGRDGRYRGKPYGVYQLWTAGERYLSSALPPVLHVVAANEPVNFVHQDAFTDAFWTAYRSLPNGSVVHVVSRETELPSMRDLWMLWLETYGGPREVHLYTRMTDVPLDEIDPQLRLWLDFTAVNNDIASVRWNFRMDRLDEMRRSGLAFRDVSLESMRLVQTRFVADSPKVQSFIERYRAAGTEKPRFILHASAEDTPASKTA